MTATQTIDKNASYDEQFITTQIITGLILSAPVGHPLAAYNGKVLPTDSSKPDTATHTHALIAGNFTPVPMTMVIAYVGSSYGFCPEGNPGTSPQTYEGWLWLASTSRTYTAKTVCEAISEVLRLTGGPATHDCVVTWHRHSFETDHSTLISPSGKRLSYFHHDRELTNPTGDVALAKQIVTEEILPLYLTLKPNTANGRGGRNWEQEKTMPLTARQMTAFALLAEVAPYNG